MAVRLTVRLNEEQRTEVERRYQAPRDAETRTRYQMVLLAADGKPAPQIGWMTRRSEDTVRRVLGRFLHQGLDAIPRRDCRSQWSKSEPAALHFAEYALASECSHQPNQRWRISAGCSRQLVKMPRPDR
jgi:hypothetical protein